MNGQYRIGDVVLDNWTLARPLGEGAFGKVYEARREEYGTSYAAAIKIMTIPSSPSEIENARAEGMDDASIRAYFDGFVGSVVNEFALMSELKGTANIVSCEDFRVLEHTDGLGWDILIRMELLTPMLKYMSGHEMTRSDIIKLGIDMCHALELCQRYNIIHRDIKPENIFVSRTGDYKLGDFGVARTLEKTTGGLSKKGTYTYMAPEIYRDEDYGSTVDIYSLGIVLYRLLNNNRAPFLPPPPQAISYSEREQALQRRIGGEPLPPPANAQGRLAEIVLRACAYDPKDRYSSPLQMRQELEAIQYARGDDELIYGGDETIRIERSQYTNQRATLTDEDRTVSAAPAAGGRPARPAPAPAREVSVGTGEKKKKTGLIAAAAAVVALAAIALIVLLPKLKGPDASVGPAPAATAAPDEGPAPAAEEDAAFGWDFSPESGVLTIRGAGAMPDYTREEPAPWADDAERITQIAIGERITRIGDYAFLYSENLRSVTIPESVASIGEAAFYGCGALESVTLPAGVRELGGKAFSYCGALKSLTLPEGLASIGDLAFSSCGALERVTLPSSVTEIGSSVFKGCGKLASIGLASGGEHFALSDGALLSKDGKRLLCRPAGLSGDSCAVPAGVETIDDCAFYGCGSLKAVTLPEGLLSIGKSAFENCGALKAVTLPEGLLSIGKSAFENCGALTRLTIPASVSGIGEAAFCSCGKLASIEVSADNPHFRTEGGLLLSLDDRTLLCRPAGMPGDSCAIPEGIEAVGEAAFADCGELSSVTFPRSLVSIGDDAFYRCEKLTAAELPEGLVSIGSRAFEYCGALRTLTLPSSVTEIGSRAFYACERLTAAAIPAGVTEIGERSFYWCEAMVRLTLPEGLVSVGDYAFYNCRSLPQLKLPESLRRIGEGAFGACESLSAVTIPANVAEIGEQAFTYCNALAAFEVVSDSAYFRSVGGVLFSADGKRLVAYPAKKPDSSYSVPNGVVSLPAYLFVNCGYLKTLSLPESVTEISDTALIHCIELERINVPAENPAFLSVDGVLFTKDGSALLRFPPEKSASSYRIPDGVREIGRSAFQYSFDLKSVSIPESVVSIGSYAFFNCNGLRSVELPEGVVSIGRQAFSSCMELRSVTLPESVTEIGTAAFAGCTAMTTAAIPGRVTALETNLFSGCGGLRSVSLPAGLAEIGAGAFNECFMLTAVDFAGSAEQWARIAVGERNEALRNAVIRYGAP